ncbi:hypothetical protein CDD81_566 [Ophiocordyceps australis]|uniref:GPI ethanolamine phosphate transferase 2 C-terminal domain-containing protein n=1 Tax=Ophiocordyceps australis TaxID=1399860 RepID=A0A2C5YGM1_9HYPO|nr:hypothetical protein CDD81_566 [Ophiocordyceps australis]
MAPESPRPAKAAETSSQHKSISEEWKQAKQAKEAQDAEAARLGLPTQKEGDKLRQRLNEQRQAAYERRWRWAVAFWIWLLIMHVVGLWIFTRGFLLSRLVLEDKSSCGAPPAESKLAPLSIEAGCWHPKTFDRAVVIIIDALRYDFTIPSSAARSMGHGEPGRAFGDAFPFLYETAVAQPQNAFLRPFIADPPTTTLQRLKGLTTGTLPTFVDAGSNFAGTAIEEDNLLAQLRAEGKKIAHVGDDTWWALFPGYFEANISRAYDSFNVWDLHSVDNGVMDNMMPLLDDAQSKGQWDVLIGHCLGVDHAGHRYGPDHVAMNAKLSQMDDFVRRLVGRIGEDTLLIVMGDHGMDAKGDHGGESDDEVEAALWMYSKRPLFGRTRPEDARPPLTAKERPTNQIDLVPTLALLLGIPIPFNNLGRPIEEAFAGALGSDWANLAAVSRMASAGIERYQRAYFAARGMSPDSGPGSPAQLWTRANGEGQSAEEAYRAFARFQEETLRVCKGLWARFDVPRMAAGVCIAAAGLVLLLMYASRRPDDAYVVVNDVELDYAERRLELSEAKRATRVHADQWQHKELLGGMLNVRFVLVTLPLVATAVWRRHPLDALAGLLVVLTMATVSTQLQAAGKRLANVAPRGFWGWLAVGLGASQCIGFASNSYTVWEDGIVLFLLSTFGLAAAVAAFGIEAKAERALALYHALAFVVLGRLASYSKLCREEQMPYCTSTYYASAASSTSAPWQLAIPFVVLGVLPSIIKSFLTPTASYHGLAPLWIGYVLRASLGLSAVYWVIDAADNGNWLASSTLLPDGALKALGVYTAQLGLALALVAGTTAYVWAPPCVSVVSAGRARVVVLGYANALGARYLLLPLNVLSACLVLSKPMGGGALALMLWQVLSLAETTHRLGLKTEPIGPVVMALLGMHYFFKTGHQASLASIQWDSAFIPLFSVRYPWSPLAVLLNTFAGPILAAACLPLLTLWRTGPRQRGGASLEVVARAAAVFVGVYAAQALASMACAAWLRRHLMLFRVFSPRFLLAGVLLLLMDVVLVVVVFAGLRTNALAVGEVFGWPE